MSVKDSQELKQLQTRKVKIECEIDSIAADIDSYEKRHTQLMSQFLSISNKITRLTSKNKELIVSEHAIIRYLERAMGMDLEQIKKEILTQDTVISIKALGNGKYPITGDCKAIVKDNTVISVV